MLGISFRSIARVPLTALRGLWLPRLLQHFGVPGVELGVLPAGRRRPVRKRGLGCFPQRLAGIGWS